MSGLLIAQTRSGAAYRLAAPFVRRLLPAATRCVKFRELRQLWCRFNMRPVSAPALSSRRPEVPVNGRSRSGSSSRLAIFAGALALVLGASACKKKDKPSCAPEDQTFAIRVLLQPTEQLNLDDDGEPLATVVRLYQLSGDMNLQMLDFNQVWQHGGQAAFGDEYISEQQLTVYPGRPEVVEVEPTPQTSHLLAVAIFREPMGQSWYRTWTVPRYHGHSVCNAQKEGKVWDDPCFYVLIDRNQVDGGHTAPAGFDREKMTVTCPGPPLLNPPPAPKSEKSKKQEKKEERKKKRKERFKRAQEADVPEQPEGPSTPEGPSAPEKPSAPGR